MIQLSDRLFQTAGFVLQTLPIILVLALCAAATQARAAPRVSTETLYYNVRGDSAGTLLAYMLRHGPRGESGRALGTTSAVIRQDSGFTETNTCRLQNYYVELELTLRLPRLAPGTNLSGTTQRNWNRFVNYVTTHENQHKTIYTRCARRIDRRVRALSGTMSCSALRAEMRSIFTEENRRCDAQHVEFDSGEEARIQALPFIVQALGNTERSGGGTHAASSQSQESRQSVPRINPNAVPIEDLR